MVTLLRDMGKLMRGEKIIITQFGISCVWCLRASDIEAGRIEKCHHLPIFQTISSCSETLNGVRLMYRRRQLPIRLHYACAVDSSQGTTLYRSCVDTSHGFFAHGHAFTAFTRVSRPENMIVLVRQNQKSIKNPLNPYILDFLAGRREKINQLLKAL